MFAIETVELTKRYGASTAVDRLEFKVEANTIHGFLGPKGAGKILFGGPLLQSSFVELYTEPLYFILLRSILVTIAYILVSLFSWFTFKRAQVLE